MWKKNDLLRHASAFVTLSDKQAEMFIQYMDLLLEWNKKMNLTTITQPEQILAKHFVDSLSLFRFITTDKPYRIVDAGTGAGFPGVPLAIAAPHFGVTLMDSLGKRLKFLDEVAYRLGLTNTNRVHARMEDAGRNARYREAFDIAVARGVARMSVLSEYCLPLVKPGGYFYALKGDNAAEETQSAHEIIKILGGHATRVEPIIIEDEYSGEPLRHTIVTIQKIMPTPESYPRRGKVIERHISK
ncbi:MAG: 16S rRNA (guanine(527)-N(7))-methyltransferase RsmG [Clostridiales bacterium]|nr:16S rRNA (guanine(527)-N(7))-methyltransferase RsmG [Clostridiales bacterium]